MTGSGPPWRKAKPFAAPSAILILLDHGRGMVPSINFSNPISLMEEIRLTKDHQ